MRMLSIVAAAILLVCPAMFSQTPGTCAGMAPGQLTSLNGFVPFQGTDSRWNTDISSAPLDSNSAKIIGFIGSTTPLHPDFGSGEFQGQSIGIPYQVVTNGQPNVVVLLGVSADESDPGPMLIPPKLSGGSAS